MSHRLARRRSSVQPSAAGVAGNQAAYSPVTKFIYTTAIEWCEDVTVFKEEPREGQTFFGGSFVAKDPKGERAHSHLDAYDPVTGRSSGPIRRNILFLRPC
jgi:hypothetical protein